MWVLAKSLYNYRVWVYNFKILVNLWFLVFFPLTLLLLRTWAIWPIFHYNRIHSDLSWCDGPFSWPSKGNWSSAVKYVPTSSRGGRDGWWIVIIISRRPNKGPPIRAPLQEHYIDRRAICRVCKAWCSIQYTELNFSDALFNLLWALPMASSKQSQTQSHYWSS